MQLGGFGFARIGSLFAVSFFVLFALAQFNLLAQNTSEASPSRTPDNLPAAQTLSQAATSSSGAKAEPASAEAESQDSDSRDSLVSGPRNGSSVRLRSGDLIEVSVYNVPELSTKARVGNSGDVYLPLIDYVHVGDLTVDQAQAVIEKRLDDGGLVRNAHVTVVVAESTQGVTVIGEVAKPGIYPAVGDRKLYDLISAAGGFTAAAGRKVSIIRQPNESSAITVDLPRNLADNLQDNITIFPGDTITVPRAPIIYVVGDVGRPAGLLVDNGSLTVLQALALAGGTNRTAKMGAARIIRKGPDGMVETKVPLKKMLEAKAPDVTLQADDILFIPVSGLRVATGQGIQAAVSAATGIAVIAAHP
jgi:polysaccharide export outer membrane protein